MRILFNILFFFSIQFPASAQKVYFIYLQSDNGSPFYVKMQDKIFSSASSGYLILSNLKDSTYQFSIGFSSSRPEARFIVPISARDRGFLIKEFDRGPGLFDLQNLSVIQAQENGSKKTSYQFRNDEFTALLAKAANDTSLLYVPIYAKEEVTVQEQKPREKPELKPDLPPTSTEPPSKTAEVIAHLDTVSAGPSVNTESRLDSTVLTVSDLQVQQEGGLKTIEDSTGHQPVGGPDMVQQSSAVTSTGEYKRSVVKKYSESSTSEGFGLVFHDSDGDNTDTIRILIPNPLFAIKENEAKESTAQLGEGKKETIPAEVKKNSMPSGEDRKAEVEEKDIESKGKQKKKEASKVKEDSGGSRPVETEVSVPSKIVVAVKPPAETKSKCRFRATNNDFFRLRKNMAAKESDDAMINEANRFFRTKCFTTEQIRNLSSLFLTASGKYQFFDAAYTHVSDQENFPGLESEIREEYFLNRFKALVGH